MASSSQEGEGVKRGEDDDEPTKLFRKVSVCIVADDAKELNELISKNTQTWEDASIKGWYEKGNKGHTLLSYALKMGSADCAAALMGWGCVPDDTMRTTTIMANEGDNSDGAAGASRGGVRVVKGYENLFDWADVKRAQEILIDMYDHGLSATAKEVKDALSAYYLDDNNTVHIKEQDSWISGKPPHPSYYY